MDKREAIAAAQNYVYNGAIKIVYYTMHTVSERQK